MIKVLSDLLRPYAFRGKARLLHALCPREGEREAEIFGYRMRLDRSDYIQRSIYLGTFEPFESSQVRSHLKEGMTFVDVGANVGYYTLLAASLVGRAGRVIAFEPSPYAFGRLAETVKQNNLPQAQAVNAGLGDRAGELQLFLPSTGGNHSPSMVSNGAGCPINVSVFRLDDFLADHKIDYVDLMKIDVEGYEPNVIDGAEKYLTQGKVGAILCEFNEYWLKRNSFGSEQLYRRLIALGFKSTSEQPDFRAGVLNILFKLAS